MIWQNTIRFIKKKFRTSDRCYLYVTRLRLGSYVFYQYVKWENIIRIWIIAYKLPQTNINDEGTDYKTGMPPVTYEQFFMFESMVGDIDPCLFRGNAQGEPSSKRNPVTGKSCKENFANINGETTTQSNNINTRLQTDIENNLALLSKLNGEDWLVQIYFLSFILLIIFITIKVLNKTCRV